MPAVNEFDCPIQATVTWTTKKTAGGKPAEL